MGGACDRSAGVRFSDRYAVWSPMDGTKSHLEVVAPVQVYGQNQCSMSNDSVLPGFQHSTCIFFDL